MRVLVTGGAGFLGWHVVSAILEADASTAVVNLDLLTYAGSRRAVADLDHRFGNRHRFLQGDIRSREDLGRALDDVEAVVHLAAETHVDRSIGGAHLFVDTNVLGTQRLLDGARDAEVRRFVHASTDEVYGHLPLVARLEAGNASGRQGSGPFREDDPLAPRSPYAASKAASDLMVLAAHRTHGLPVVITRGCNAYGAGQHPEKLLPLAVSRVRQGLAIPIYGSGNQVREWMHASDQARGITAALERGRAGEVYNLGGGESRANLALVRELLHVMGVPEHPITHVADRPGHDQRYALDGGKARRELRWRPVRRLAHELPALVQWYAERGEWWWS